MEIQRVQMVISQVQQLICRRKFISWSTYKHNIKTTLATKFSRFAPSDLIHFIKNLKFVQVSVAIL